MRQSKPIWRPENPFLLHRSLGLPLNSYNNVGGPRQFRYFDLKFWRNPNLAKCGFTGRKRNGCSEQVFWVFWVVSILCRLILLEPFSLSSFFRLWFFESFEPLELFESLSLYSFGSFLCLSLKCLRVRVSEYFESLGSLSLWVIWSFQWIWFKDGSC